jgi:alkylation response protein AidB-like acyl-CoA dehydrogenase
MSSADHDAVDRVIEGTVRPAAEGVDATGTFPQESLDALAAVGVLGLPMDASVGGGGGSLVGAVDVIQRLAGACGSTAMVVLMHYSAARAIDHYGPDEIRKAIAAGEHLTTLAFSESGSRSHFWVPLGTATSMASDRVRLDAKKSWITAAGEADTYVWSSRPLAADTPMTLWLVPSDSAGLSEPGQFDGLGLRGNRSAPVTAEGVTVPTSAMLGKDGAGLDIAMGEILPWFLVLNAAFSVGLMQAVTEEVGMHLRASRLEHLNVSLAETQLARMDHARMRIATDQAAALLADTLSALNAGRPDAMLRVLEVKAAAGEAAAAVTDLAMKACGGAAFRKELGIERRFRDARAIRVMAPTSDALIDMVGRAINELPLL